MALVALAPLSGKESDYQIHLSEETALRLIHFSNRYDTPLPRDFFSRPMGKQSLITFLDAVLEQSDSPQDTHLISNLRDRILRKRTIHTTSDTAGSALHLNFLNHGTAHITQPDSPRLLGRGTINPQLHGNIQGFSYYSDISILTEFDTDTTWGHGHYYPYRGIPYNLFNPEGSSNIRTSDVFRAGISFHTHPWLSWEFGVDYLSSGPAQFTPLILNTASAPMLYMQADMRFKNLRYVHMAGKLNSLRRYDKFIHYHRFDFTLRDDRIVLGFNEAIVYGSLPDYGKETSEFFEAHETPEGPQQHHINPRAYPYDRSFEGIYMVPFVPFVFAEHLNGDRDKVTISMDALVRFPGPLTLYGEFLLDDLSNPFTLFSDDWRNKWAFTVGGTYYTDLFPRDLLFFFEYARVEPWVYTHFKGASHRHTHFGKSIGAEAGPNSDQLHLAVETGLSEKHRFFLNFTNTRTDQTYRGGHINHIYITEYMADHVRPDLSADSDTKTFLKNPESEQTYSLTWNLLPYQFYEMHSTVGYHSDDGVFLTLQGVFTF